MEWAYDIVQLLITPVSSAKQSALKACATAGTMCEFLANSNNKWNHLKNRIDVTISEGNNSNNIDE